MPRLCRARRRSPAITWGWSHIAWLLLVWPLGLQADQPADLVVLGGKIVTVDPQFPVVQALSVRGDRIAAVGTSAQIATQIGPQTQVIQLDGQLVLPGFIEGHGHFVGLGEAMMILDLAAAKSWQEIIDQVAHAARQTPRGQWILGRGWHQSKWTEPPRPSVDGTPTHTALSAVTPDHPVLLTHASGHMAIANQHAMQLARLDANTPDPAGGEILHDQDGNPTGVLRERAASLVSQVHARWQQKRSAAQQRAELLRAIELASQQCLRHGVTSFHDAGSAMDLVDVFKELAQRGELPVRLYVMLNSSNDQLQQRMDQYRMIGVGNQHLTVRAVKRLVDGALGSHGAWLLEPYADLPSSRGLNTLALPDLEKTAQLALEHHFQLCVHAIGDRANREVLDLYEHAFQASEETQDRRWRIEHAQHLHPDDIPRFDQLHVLAAMQSVHATSDGPFVVARLGERRTSSGAYAWRSLLDSGATIVNGTDTPVEPIDPIAGFYASVTRQMNNGVAFYSDQCMTRAEALRSCTLNAAYAAFEEDIKGSLTPGKLADIVILSRDIMTVPADQIRRAQVAMTILGGKVLYHSPNKS